ncbi:MAG: DNA cytosine methyltransferase, partial [Betaproteobacteria bacterium]|nr:DNA cytosine methyltransferase [Betaproteobacteria bacterium]
VWENVPGVLSSNEGRDFGSILGGMVELGYGFTYRVLDAQHFGVPQRRRRVFVVGYLGDWRRAAAVLFERESLRGDSAPRREARQIAPTIPSRSSAGGGLGTDFDCDGGLIAAIQERAVCENAAAGPDGIGVRTDGLAYTLEARQQVQAVAYGGNNTSGPIDVATALNASHTASGRQDFETETFIAHTLRGEGFDASEDGTGRSAPIVPTLTGNGDAHSGYRDDKGLVHTRSTVRRLTPRECERLQGFPDDYTAIPYRNKLAADGPRYKALGNSMAVPVMRWIGERIQMVERITP